MNATRTAPSIVQDGPTATGSDQRVGWHSVAVMGTFWAAWMRTMWRLCCSIARPVILESSGLHPIHVRLAAHKIWQTKSRSAISLDCRSRRLPAALVGCEMELAPANQARRGRRESGFLSSSATLMYPGCKVGEVKARFTSPSCACAGQGRVAATVKRRRPLG
ncbi:hypothetical protein EJ04DRAFT_232254 [Polyplosphaeria fusca]|uniref:Uncharacterized protein n=1 Tax=Polyplosphaeria fusca TaxID=682080 RepID=A0A9P4RBM2_9PLEO|nr:hypothetical protein EJ04DRAFT_232254 [Polyplosphaeria fusca]